jgi:hypothetical protein
MAEEKKSEAGRKQPQRLGPYLLHEQVEQSHDSPVELYLATHETSGATALVRKHTAGERAAARKDWRVRLGCWALGGYSAMEVEHTDWARAQDRQSAESLLPTLEGVLEEVRHMARDVDDTHEPRLQWRPGWGVVSAASVCTLLLALVCLAPGSQRPSAPEPEASAESASMSHDAPMKSETLDPRTSAWLGDTAPPGDLVFARPLPRQPFKGQKRPPCTRLVEVELIGACWGPHELKAPCPDELFEHQGKCYAPIFSARPPPQSVGQ